MAKASMGLRSAALAATAAIVLAACGGGDGGGDSGDNGDSGAAGGEPTKGGTLTFLTVAEQIDHLDPQRNYTGEDLAFASAYLTRTLTAYKMSTDDAEANTIVPDLATDTGTPNEDSSSWSFTLKDGPMFEDGSPITCEDVKYGVSRTFATDVITDGPQYAVAYLDIPKDDDGASVYKGPYVTKNNDTAAFDEAVTCDGQTITFNLANPVPDFNYTVTLTSFAPVPKAADTNEKYDDKPVSSGPYKIQEYSKGNQLVLVRNENWSPESDDYRGAYPDEIVMKFGIEPSVRDQRIIRATGEDQTAVSRDQPDPSSLATIFQDDALEDRRADVLDAYAYYYVLDVNKVPNLQHRQAIAAALDRAQIIKVSGGDYAGEISDGVIKPNLPQDYAESGLWTELLGQEIPDSGDPDYAKQLIEESGEPMPTIRFNYSTPTRDKEAAVVKQSLEAAGIPVELKPLEAGVYYSIVFDPEKAGEMMWSGWGPDWPNASTIIPELFTPAGGFNLTRVDDADFNERVQAAKEEVDRDAQAELWKELNKEAMANVWAIPTRAGRSQAIAGPKVKSASGEDGNIYLWSPYTSWPYNDMYLEQ
jgi:peptide/nickel transport system substrate-binding protein